MPVDSGSLSAPTHTFCCFELVSLASMTAVLLGLLGGVGVLWDVTFGGYSMVGLK